MAEHPLDRFDVPARADRETRGGVPQLVRCQSSLADCLRSFIEPTSTENASAQPSASSCREDWHASFFAFDMRLQFCQDRGRHRDGSGFLVLRIGVDLDSVDLDDGVLDFEASAFEVDVLDSEPRGLAPAQAAVCKHEDEQTVAV